MNLARMSVRGIHFSIKPVEACWVLNQPPELLRGRRSRVDKKPVASVSMPTPLVGHAHIEVRPSRPADAAREEGLARRH